MTDPVGWWIEPFTDNSFMVTALVAGLLAVVATSVVGTWVVLRGISFFGESLSHGVLPGVAIAYVMGANTTFGAFAAALAMVGGVNLVRKYSPLPDDTSIGLLLVGFLALAIVIMSGSRGAGSGDLSRFLFGSITGLDQGDLVRQGVAAVIAVVGVVVLHRALLVGTFDEQHAELLGLRPGLSHAALLVLLTVAIVASFESVGSLLVFSFLVAPPATATLLVRKVSHIMVVAVGLGSAAVVIGLLTSFHKDTAASATMALMSVVLFVLALTGTGVWRAVRARSLVGAVQAS